MSSDTTVADLNARLAQALEEASRLRRALQSAEDDLDVVFDSSHADAREACLLAVRQTVFEALAGSTPSANWLREKLAAAWNLGHLCASQSDEAYPAKTQREIDIDMVLNKEGPR